MGNYSSVILLDAPTTLTPLEVLNSVSTMRDSLKTLQRMHAGTLQVHDRVPVGRTRGTFHEEEWSSTL